jgi:hypothetical protein
MQPAPPPPSNSSTTQTAGPTPSRLLSLFKECVDNGVWARLVTYRRRGTICVDFNCQIEVSPTAGATAAAVGANPRRQPNRLSKKRREWKMERMRKWKESRNHRHHPPPSTVPDSAALPAATTAAVIEPAPTITRSYADVVVQAPNVPATAAHTENVATTATAGQRGRKASVTDPKKRAKDTLVASRTSQRAAVLSKKRGVEDMPTAASSLSAVEEDEAAPEILRGMEGETRLDSLELSLNASPPPPPPPLSPPSQPTPGPSTAISSPKERTCNCTECTVECEEDYYDEKVEDGRLLNTRKPDWGWVFPKRKGL